LDYPIPADSGLGVCEILNYPVITIEGQDLVGDRPRINVPRFSQPLVDGEAVHSPLKTLNNEAHVIPDIFSPQAEAQRTVGTRLTVS
jgi:hypothetical protein